MRVRHSVVMLSVLLLFIAYPTSPLRAQEKPGGAPTGEQDQNQGAQAEEQNQTQDTQAEESEQDKKIEAICKKNPKDKKCVDTIGNRNVGKGPNLYSIQKEIALGKMMAQQVEKYSKILDDQVITEYVNRVGQNLVRNSDAKVPFTIKVIDSDEINAFALPGGFFYVNSGLILRADEEAELAGVMAHEIAHVAARHGTKNATKAQIAQWGSIVPLILLGGGWAGYGTYQALNIIIPMGFLKFSRDAEREADYLGLQYMDRAGYDPNAFVSFFEKIVAEEKRKPGSIPKLFSSHPPTPERIQKAQQEIATILPTREEYLMTTSEFDVIKALLQAKHAKDKLQDKKNPDKPTLRTRTDQTQTQQDKTGEQRPSDSNSDDPDRPTLKKRPGDP